MKKIPVRRCAVCLTYSSRDNMVRLAQLSDKSLVWEMGKRPPGKGIYICNNGLCISKFIAEKKFRKRFHDRMKEDVLEHLKILGERNLLNEG